MLEPTLYIIEDEFIVVEELSEVLKSQGYHVIGSESDPEIAMREIITSKPDVLIVDINLNSALDGIDLVQEVQKQYVPIIIFLTAYDDKETLNRAKLARPAAYLLKPFDQKSIDIALELALSQRGEKKPLSHLLNRDTLFLKIKGRYQKIITDEILFIQADGSYCNIQLRDDKMLISHCMAELFRKIDSKNFVQIHRKYIVNLQHIDSFDASNIYIQEHILPIGDSYKAEVFSLLK